MKQLGESLEFTAQLVRQTSFSTTPIGESKNKMILYVENDHLSEDKEWSGVIEWIYFIGLPHEDAIHIGIWVKNNTLVDYDGTFSFPKKAVKLLNQNKIRVPREFRH